MDHTKFHYRRDGFRKKGVPRIPCRSHASLLRAHHSLFRNGDNLGIMKLYAFVILAVAAALAAGQTIDNCLQKDSISCLQKSLYRKAKEFFDTDNLEVVSGVSLVKSGDSQSRSSRTGKDLAYDQEIDSANNVADRQNALVNFVSEEAGEFLTGRSLKVIRVPCCNCSTFLLENTCSMFARYTSCLM